MHLAKVLLNKKYSRLNIIQIKEPKKVHPAKNNLIKNTRRLHLQTMVITFSELK